jgi:hypothetical protein
VVRLGCRSGRRVPPRHLGFSSGVLGNTERVGNNYGKGDCRETPASSPARNATVGVPTTRGSVGAAKAMEHDSFCLGESHRPSVRDLLATKPGLVGSLVHSSRSRRPDRSGVSPCANSESEPLSGGGGNRTRATLLSGRSPILTCCREPMRKSDVVGCEVTSVHLESRIVVGRWLPVGT